MTKKNDLEMYFVHIVKENKTYRYMTSFSKNIYIDKLDDTITKYNNKYNHTTKMEQIKSNAKNLAKKLVMKILNLKLVTLLEYENMKVLLKKLHPKLVWRTFCY